jgi:hypothetical protein
MPVSSPVGVGFPAVRTSGARGSLGEHVARVEQGKRQSRRGDTSTATDLLRVR